MTGTVGSVARPADWLTGDVIGVPTEGTLGNAAFGRAREGQSVMLQLINCPDRFVTHEPDRVLVAQVIRTFDRVEGMPFPVVFFIAPQCCANATLGGAGVRAGRVELAQYSDIGGLGSVQGCHQACTARPHHHDIELMFFHRVAPLIAVLFLIS